VAGFIAQGHLGPAYRFYHRYRIVGEDGRVLGYKNLNQLRKTLQPILLRRTRDDVMRQLPERSNEYIRITPTAEQRDLHDEAMRQVGRIVKKSYFTEMDLLRLRQQLAIARMSANSTFLVEKKEPEYSTKLDRLTELFEQFFAERDRKIVLFSEWTKMLDRVEKRLRGFSAQYVRLDGDVPQKKRAVIVDQFQSDAACRLILMSNAGTTGLNLQAANTVVNVDLPWNPAVLEQRIGRAHRMGQTRPVQVYLLISEGTIEEKMLGTLSSKQDLAMAALDVNSTVNEVELVSGMEELKRRLEKLLAPVPLAPVDRSQLERVSSEARDVQAKRERVAAAGGQLLGAAFELLSQLIGQSEAAAPDAETVASLRSGLDQCVDRDAAGRPRLSITLNDDATLQRLAQTLASLLVN
jgi:SNF2 family DNA or RNA helicase